MKTVFKIFAWGRLSAFIAFATVAAFIFGHWVFGVFLFFSYAALSIYLLERKCCPSCGYSFALTELPPYDYLSGKCPNCKVPYSKPRTEMLGHVNTKE